jgi:hypothetical protein
MTTDVSFMFKKTKFKQDLNTEPAHNWTLTNQIFNLIDMLTNWIQVLTNQFWLFFQVLTNQFQILVPSSVVASATGMLCFLFGRRTYCIPHMTHPVCLFDQFTFFCIVQPLTALARSEVAVFVRDRFFLFFNTKMHSLTAYSRKKTNSAFLYSNPFASLHTS